MRLVFRWIRGTYKVRRILKNEWIKYLKAHQYDKAHKSPHKSIINILEAVFMKHMESFRKLLQDTSVVFVTTLHMRRTSVLSWLCTIKTIDSPRQKARRRGNMYTWSLEWSKRGSDWYRPHKTQNRKGCTQRSTLNMFGFQKFRTNEKKYLHCLFSHSACFC